MLLTLRSGRSAVSARATADAVISALTPAAWYRNATGVTSAGGFASKWDDYSGNARHLVQGTGTNQPAYSAGVITGDGADNFLRTAAFTFDQPSTVVAIMRQDSWTLDDSVWDGATALNRRRMYTPGSTPNMTMYAGGVGPANAGATIGTWRVVKAFYNGASSTLNVDNGVDATGNAGTNTASGLTLLADGQATPTAYGAESFAEVILISGELSAGDWTSLYNALDAIRDTL